MKRVLFLFLAAFIVSCNGHKKGAAGRDANAGTTAPATGAKDSLTWKDQFREFRNAVYAHDKAKVKQFVSFPIMNDNNEIWYVANNGTLGPDMSSDTIKPFTEQDFDRYFDQLFSKEFITALLKVKSEELYKKNYAETMTFEKRDHSTYRMYATYNAGERFLVLNLNTNVAHEGQNDESDAGGEFSIEYYFTVSTDNHLKFKQIRIAG